MIPLGAVALTHRNKAEGPWEQIPDSCLHRSLSRGWLWRREALLSERAVDGENPLGFGGSFSADSASMI